MTEIEAKVKYVKLARSLRTYGVSFFLVKVRFGLELNLLNEIQRLVLATVKNMFHKTGIKS